MPKKPPQNTQPTLPITARTAIINLPSKNPLIGYLSEHTEARIKAVSDILSDFNNLATNDPNYKISVNSVDGLFLINLCITEAYQYETKKELTLQMELDLQTP